ncbi:MAG TPA: hypothetical protein ENJ95_16350 [Bacteroidetes bacterium]|nr:hypothetical protein [Bacteroidota bacterium]
MPPFSKKEAEKLALEYFGIHATASPLPSYADLNFLLKTKSGKKYVLKIYKPGEEKEQLEAQNEMLLHLEKHLPQLTFPRIIKNKNGENTTLLKSKKNGQRLLRLLTWVEGRMLVNVNPHSPRLLKNLGQSIGHLCNGLRGFDHPAAHRYFEWDTAQAAWTERFFHFIKNKEKRALAEHFYGLSIKNALPKLPALRHSVLHNDANDFNVLVNADPENPAVSGIIDFGDIVHSATVNELAIAIAYAVQRKNDPLTAAAQIVAGTHEIFPLEEQELELLYHLIAARLLISLTSAAINISKNPGNEYLKVSQQPGWDLLEKWKAVPAALAHFTFRQACGFEA